MGEVLKKFGRYFLLDHIAQGGMAEIYRARLASFEGGSRLLVIKRIQAGYGSNPDFIRMFRSEIKVTMGFNHPNIVQVYDFGEEQNQLYIAMEFVDGKTLRQFLARLAEQKQLFPVELATHIILQAASGLHYAHVYKDKLTGQPLHVVHRDISPQNILISFEGNVKVIDFGIAKAASSTSEMTRAGVIKGKPSYLSPEQISGDPIDGRCDVFGLGIVFWELLAGRKLFAGENDLAVLKLIESCNTHVKPPSTYNSQVPKELDYIVLKALAKQPEKRYQTAEEFQRALHKFLFAKNPDFDSVDLSFFSKNLFKDEIVDDRKLLQKLNEKVEKLLGSEVSEGNAPEGILFSQTRREDSITHVNDHEKASSLRVVDSPVGKGIKVEIEGGGTRSLKRPPYSQHTRTHGGIPVRQPQQAKPKKSGLRLAFVSGLAAVVAYVFWFSEGLIPFVQIPQVVPSPARTIATQTPQGESTPTTPVERVRKFLPLKLNLLPWNKGARVVLNGKEIDLASSDHQIELDVPLVLEIEMPGFSPLRREFTVSSEQANGKTEWLMDIQLEVSQANMGLLSLRTTPSAEKIYLNGVDWKKQTPIQNEKLPAGIYTIRVENPALEMEKTVEVVIEEGKAIKLDLTLEVLQKKSHIKR